MLIKLPMRNRYSFVKNDNYFLVLVKRHITIGQIVNLGKRDFR